MFPIKPDFKPLIDNETRMKVFGELSYIAAPIKGNPENISIQGSWARDNLCITEIPQLIGIAGAPHDGKVQCHKSVADAIRFLFQDLEQRNLLDLIHTWDGMFCPRFVRGSKTTLSNHSFGTAFDINVQWNPINKPPAIEGKLGCLYEIVPVANTHGFYWGGHYAKRPDGMHFEYSRISS
jgi:hypothetical protein